MSKIDVVQASQTHDHRESIGTLLGRVPKDVRAVVTTELAVYKIEVARRGQSAGMAAAFFAIAFILVLAAIVALLVGLIMLLAQSLGLAWAIVAVVGTTLALTAVFAWLGLRNVKLAINPDGQS